jgi:hypothetical protein
MAEGHLRPYEQLHIQLVTNCNDYNLVTAKSKILCVSKCISIIFYFNRPYCNFFHRESTIPLCVSTVWLWWRMEWSGMVTTNSVRTDKQLKRLHCVSWRSKSIHSVFLKKTELTVRKIWRQLTAMNNVINEISNSQILHQQYKLKST